jgi:urease accessory protein
MTALDLFHRQRSQGRVDLAVGARGLKRLREEGAAKVRLPPGSNEAILINTSGGLAGGDQFAVSVTAGRDAVLSLTTQAAERCYRTLGPPALVHAQCMAEDGSRLFWLPQELIIYDGASLERRLEADVAASSRFLAVETLVFGRQASGETVRSAVIKESWRIRREGRLVFAEEFGFDGALPKSLATFDGAAALATVVLVAEDAEEQLEATRQLLNEAGGASAWNGKLVARLLAPDGFGLRKTLVPLLRRLAGPQGLPRIWAG